MKICTTIIMMVLWVSPGFSKADKVPATMIDEPSEKMMLFDTVVGSNAVRMLQIKANMVVDTAEDLLDKVDRAKAKGANTVLFGDTKLNAFGVGNDPGAKWRKETQKLFDGIRARDMDLVLATSAMGFCGSLIADNTNLTTGYPIENQRLKAINGRLVPISTATIANGGFDSYTGDRPANWSFQDAPGERTFIDTKVSRTGAASFRAEARGGEMSRVSTNFPVTPFHQYTLSVWVKMDNLTAKNIQVVLRDQNDLDRNLTVLDISKPSAKGGREYIGKPQNETLDWTEVRIAFNSQDAVLVNLGLSVFGGTTGTIWWDDVSISDTPTLNWLNRDDLPTSIRLENGRDLRFGTDVELPVDSLLGFSRYEGRYDTQHIAPQVAVLNPVSVREGAVLEISGYHALPTAKGQVSCSWNNAEVLDRLRRVHQKLQDTYRPDAFLINYSEVRTGGWEPSDTEFPTSGAAFAAAIKKAFDDLIEISPDTKHYFWSDMIDPEHNARDKYYQVNNTLADAHKTLDTNKVILATWWEGEKITNLGPSSLKFFADKGFEQVIGAYYDADVDQNFNRWQTAAQDVNGIIGNMFATWQKNYENIEAFGDLWWAQTDVPAVDDAILAISAPQRVTAGSTQNISIAYTAKADRELMVSFQLSASPWTTYGWFKTRVPGGEGTIEVPLEIYPDAPFSNSGYTLVAYTAPLGGTYDNYIVLDKVSKIGVDTLENSIGQAASTELSVYPNPADTYVKVEVQESTVAIDMYDIHGNLVHSADPKDEKTIDVSQLNPGMYLLSVEEKDGNTEVKKVIIAH